MAYAMPGCLLSVKNKALKIFVNPVEKCNPAGTLAFVPRHAV